MALSHSTAKYIALASFIADVAAQITGLLTTPNMIDIHYANYSFFSPDLSLVSLGFVPLQLLQVRWLFKLYTLDFNLKTAAEKDEAQKILDFVPSFAIFHIALIVWVISWNSSHIALSFAVISINAIVQLWYMTLASQVQPLSTAEPSSTARSYGTARATSISTTEILSQLFAALGIIDVLHTGSAAFFASTQLSAPPVFIQFAAGFWFVIATLLGGSVFGAGLAFGLIAFAAGKHQDDWRLLLGVYAAFVIGLLGLKAGRGQSRA